MARCLFDTIHSDILDIDLQSDDEIKQTFYTRLSSLKVPSVRARDQGAIFFNSAKYRPARENRYNGVSLGSLGPGLVKLIAK
jgi:hypothetical protein